MTAGSHVMLAEIDHFRKRKRKRDCTEYRPSRMSPGKTNGWDSIRMQERILYGIGNCYKCS